MPRVNQGSLPRRGESQWILQDEQEFTTDKEEVHSRLRDKAQGRQSMNSMADPGPEAGGTHELQIGRASCRERVFRSV